MCFYQKRNINGLLLLDKPKGLSSNTVLQQVKKIFNAKKAGYTGTLDPLATGMLPICFGESTKFSKYLTESNKKYYVVAKLGINTSTSDSEGVITKKRPICFTSINLYSSIEQLIGVIQQIPPMYSAIKYKGIPLYKYARKGLTIQRNIRNVTIYEINSIEHNKDLLSFNVVCSKGTYIRTLIEDLGEKLGCGAHIITLRRLQVASFPSSKLVTFSDLNKYVDLKKINDFFHLDNFLMPIDSPIAFLPKIYLSIKQVLKFKLGQKIHCISHIKNSLLRVIDTNNQKFIGLGSINNTNVLVPLKLLSTINL